MYIASGTLKYVFFFFFFFFYDGKNVFFFIFTIYIEPGHLVITIFETKESCSIIHTAIV
jgi:hypothetical protein